MYINVDLFQWFIFFFYKKISEEVKNLIISYNELAKNYTNQLLETLRKGKYTHLLKTTFGAQI